MGVGGKVGIFFFFFLNLFIRLYIVGHPFKKYILFGWTYKNAAIAPPFKFFFIRLYIVGHPFKKYILFGWTYSRVFENAAIGPPFKNTYGPIAVAPP